MNSYIFIDMRLVFQILDLDFNNHFNSILISFLLQLLLTIINLLFINHINNGLNTNITHILHILKCLKPDSDDIHFHLYYDRKYSLLVRFEIWIQLQNNLGLPRHISVFPKSPIWFLKGLSPRRGELLI